MQDRLMSVNVNSMKTSLILFQVFCYILPLRNEQLIEFWCSFKEECAQLSEKAS